MHIEWWYWIIAGFLLIGLELIVPSFTIIWFGLGALVVGLMVYLWPSFPFSGQVFLWSAASIFFTVTWFRYLKPKSDRTHAGTSKAAIVGESGIIIRGTDDSYGRGVIRFRFAILGADEWPCYAEEILKVGDSVRVVDIEGQVLKVQKI